MSEGNEISAGHPLWKELRNGLLWHRTSTTDYRQIRIDGFIKPNDGRVNRWGGHYACQQLCGLSLFDFTSQSEALVLGEAHKWQQFLGDVGPATVMLGLERSKLCGKLTPYPDSKEGTTGNVIPWVEVCHCGPIPISAVVSYLLVCAADYQQFVRVEVLDETILTNTERNFGEIVTSANQKRAAMFDQVRAKFETPEFKAQMEEIRRRVEPTRRQG